MTEQPFWLNPLFKKLDNIARWEWIKAHANRTGADPYELLETWLEQDPGQFRRWKQQRRNI